MNKKTLLSALLIASALVTGLGCGQGFTTANQAGVADGTDQGSQGTDGGNQGADSAAEAEFQKVDMKGWISGGSETDTLSIDIDKPNKALLLRLPLGMNGNIELTEAEVPSLPGVRFYTYEDSANAKTYMVISVPLKYVVRGVGNTLPPNKLPNGDALPQIPSGELPSLAVAVGNSKNTKMYLYVGVNVVGVYVETPFDPFIKATFSVKNQTKTKVLGYFSTIPAKGSYQGGFFLSSTIPNEIALILEKVLP